MNAAANHPAPRFLTLAEAAAAKWVAVAGAAPLLPRPGGMIAAATKPLHPVRRGARSDNQQCLMTKSALPCELRIVPYPLEIRKMSYARNLLLASALTIGVVGSASALTVVGATSSNQLITFNDAAVPAISLRARLSGFTAGDTSLVSIDYRVQDGSLYGLGNAGGIYRIDDNTGVLTYLHTLQVALEGTRFTADFNPAADRLRIVSDSGQNLRHNVNNGVTLVDAPLNYPPGMPLNTVGPVASGIVAAAYTNNDLGTTTGTTLFAIDANLNQLTIVAPPNNGSLAVIGQLGADVGTMTAFDILTTTVEGVADTNVGIVALSNGVNGGSLNTLNLLTGKLTPIATTDTSVAVGRLVGISAPLSQ